MKTWFVLCSAFPCFGLQLRTGPGKHEHWRFTFWRTDCQLERGGQLGSGTGSSSGSGTTTGSPTCSPACAGSTPYCEGTVCVACRGDTDCTPGVCDIMTQTCVRAAHQRGIRRRSLSGQLANLRPIGRLRTGVQRGDALHRWPDVRRQHRPVRVLPQQQPVPQRHGVQPRGVHQLRAASALCRRWGPANLLAGLLCPVRLQRRLRRRSVYL